tara:strand:+ start:426 stop:605 length:180 start_codon:yes stop_codon:yes gene_type:complete
MENGKYTLKELSAELGWAEREIQSAIRNAFPNPTFRRTDCLYEVTRIKDGMFDVTYVGE